MPKPTNKLLTVSLSSETDFLLARQRAKQIAEILGFETQDQTRIATAVSEISRNAIEYGAGGKVDFYFDRGDRSGFLIIVSDAGGGIRNLDEVLSGGYVSGSGMGIGITGSRRLMDTLHIESTAAGTIVRMAKYLPSHVDPPSQRELGKRLGDMSTQDLGTALHVQNHEVLRLLNELRERERELSQLNQELKETNRGVMVLYSELEDRAQELQHASEMKTRFISGITHELRTPLNSIVSLSGLLIHRIDGALTPEQEKQVLFIQRSAQNLTEMVNDLLDLAKIEAGKVSVKVSDFSVGDVFAALRGMFRPLATNENVELHFDEANLSAVRLRTDEGKLGQILRNFVSNALKFTERGTVNVFAERTGSTGIRFTVADTGIGIALEHQDVVWQEWGQIEHDHKPRHKGSGLGLPLSRQLAELLGGTTGLISEPGVGSQFFVDLPSAVLEEREEEPAPAAPARREVLIVDDDEVSRYILRRNLSRLTSAQVLEAESAEEASEILKTKAPSIVFLDIVMPGMNGLDFAEELRSSSHSQIPIVLVSSKVLTPEMRSRVDRLQLSFIEKEAGDTKDQLVALERALLNIGFTDLHQTEQSS